MRYKYLVYAFYTTFKKRVTGYNSKAEAYEYISALRMCETPYLFIENSKIPKIISVEYFDMSKEELIKQFESEEHL